MKKMFSLMTALVLVFSASIVGAAPPSQQDWSNQAFHNGQRHPDGLETTGKVPAVLFIPITDNTGLKDPHGYLLEGINAQYAKKYPAEKFTVISLQNYTNQVSTNPEPETDDKVIKVAAAAGADYVVRTDLQKIEIRRGIKGIFLKKWCSADIPVRITIWDVASGKAVFDDIIQVKGEQTSSMGSSIGLVRLASGGGTILSAVGPLSFVSEKATIKNGLVKIGKKMSEELPSL